METRRQVGVLLPVSILWSVVHGRPTYEYASAYTAGAAKYGLEVVLFSLKGYNPQTGAVRGYVERDGAWIPWTGPLPPVIHNRQLPGSPREIHLVRRLERQLGLRFFNPLVARDKWRVWQQLAGSPAVRDHLPPTWPLTVALCHTLPRLAQKEGGIVIKPRIGSWGLGIRFVEPMADDRFRLVPARGRIGIVSSRGLVRLAVNLRRLRLYIVQQTVPLVRY
ncbi:MAG: YheC/YheD family protein, partial [Symbiobacteriaceae bacterium]